MAYEWGNWLNPLCQSEMVKIVPTMEKRQILRGPKNNERSERLTYFTKC